MILRRLVFARVDVGRHRHRGDRRRETVARTHRVAVELELTSKRRQLRPESADMTRRTRHARLLRETGHSRSAACCQRKHPQSDKGACDVELENSHWLLPRWFGSTRKDSQYRPYNSKQAGMGAGNIHCAMSTLAECNIRDTCPQRLLLNPVRRCAVRTCVRTGEISIIRANRRRDRAAGLRAGLCDWAWSRRLPSPCAR